MRHPAPAPDSATPAADEAASLPPTAQSLPIALIRAREKVMGPIRCMLASANVTEQQWRVLRVLHESGPRSGMELARDACLQTASLSRIIQTLVDKKYVKRCRDQVDRRRQTISLLPAGERMIEDNTHESRRIARHLEQRFGPDKQRQLLALLDELNRVDL